MIVYDEKQFWIKTCNGLRLRNNYLNNNITIITNIHILYSDYYKMYRVFSNFNSQKYHLDSRFNFFTKIPIEVDDQRIFGTKIRDFFMIINHVSDHYFNFSQVYPNY